MFVKIVRVVDNKFISMVDHNIYTVEYKFRNWTSPVLENSRLYAWHVKDDRINSFLDSFTTTNLVVFIAELEDPRVLKYAFLNNVSDYLELWKTGMELLPKDFVYQDLECNQIVCTRLKLTHLVRCRSDRIDIVKNIMNSQAKEVNW